MRDDLREHFSELSSLLGKKMIIYARLNEHCARIRYSNDHAVEGEISLLLKENAHLIDELTSLDTPIAREKTAICLTCGIEEGGFAEYFGKMNSVEFVEVETKLREIEEQKRLACKHYEAICNTIDTAVDKTQHEITSLARLREIMDLTDRG